MKGSGHLFLECYYMYMAVRNRQYRITGRCWSLLVGWLTTVPSFKNLLFPFLFSCSKFLLCAASVVLFQLACGADRSWKAGPHVVALIGQIFLGQENFLLAMLCLQMKVQKDGILFQEFFSIPLMYKAHDVHQYLLNF